MLEDRDVTSRVWFHTGQQKLVIEDYHPAVLLGNLLPHTPDPWRFVDIAGPIRDSEGKLQGVLAIHLSWKWAPTLARDLLTPAIREFGAEILVVRSDGVVMLGPDDMVEQRLATDSLKLAWQGKSGAIRECWPDGRMYVTGFSRTGRTAGAVDARRPDRLAEPACADADAAGIDGEGGARRPHVRRDVPRYGWLQAGQRHAWP